MKIEFFVPGTPAPGGSKRGFYNPKSKRVLIVDASPRSRPWKALVADFALREMGDRPPMEGPIELELIFVMPRPKSHFGTGKNAAKVKDSAPGWHTTKPDRTKLMRSTEDALKGIVWRDDCQVCDGVVRKGYGPTPGVWIKAASLIDFY